jgi:hypothetical protein
MKNKIFICLLILFWGSALVFAGDLPPADGLPPGVKGDGNSGLTVEGSVTMGSPISATGTEYTIWEVKDSNGDIVAACTVECSNITDGSQVCQIHYYVMSDTAGTLTEEFTIDVDSD